MKRQLDLTTLVGSRICHDLISPLGAISNGVELMGMTGSVEGPEMALISESVENANARIKFFRIAYGAAAEGQNLGRSEVTSTLAATARGGRLSYHWRAEGEQPRREVRLAFLLLQCFENAMPYGGEITISRDGNKWELVGESDRMKIDENLWESLINPRLRPNIRAAEVQFALLPQVLEESGRSLALKLDTAQITARF